MKTNVAGSFSCEDILTVSYATTLLIADRTLVFLALACHRPAARERWSSWLNDSGLVCLQYRVMNS